jgi:hypothetical protein
MSIQKNNKKTLCNTPKVGVFSGYERNFGISVSVYLSYGCNRAFPFLFVPVTGVTLAFPFSFASVTGVTLVFPFPFISVTDVTGHSRFRLPRLRA